MTEITIQEIVEVYKAILDGKISRNEADRWAWSLIQKEDNRELIYIPAELEDLIWNELGFISGIDSPAEIQLDGSYEYLFPDEQIEERLDGISMITGISYKPYGKNSQKPVPFTKISETKNGRKYSN